MRLLMTISAMLLWSIPTMAATVTVPPGANIQSYVNANIAGTTYQLSDGIYSQQTVQPKSGDTFKGAPGLTTIMDGGGGTSEKHAFIGYSTITKVTVDGLVIRNYFDSLDPNLLHGVIYFTTGNANSGWVIQNSDIGPNKGAGIVPVSGVTVKNNKIHDNGWLGIHGYTGTSNILVDNNDIYNNNTDHSSCFGSTAFTGGVKIFNVSYITFSNNKIHDNYCTNLWFDTNFHHVSVINNEIYNVQSSVNPGIGLWFEIGLSGGSYTDNPVYGNNIHDNYVGMLISTSSDLDIHNNTFTANRVATIRAFEEPRGTGSNGVTWQERHVHIHNNTFTYSTGVNSQRDTGSGFKWYNQDNTYKSNIYNIPCGPGDFSYQGERYISSNGTLLSYKAWRALPSHPDINSTFKCGN